MTAENPAPVLRIVKGEPTPEELAALVSVIAGMGGGAETPKPSPQWSAHHRKVRTTLPNGPGGWRSSGLPR
ncbi:acyl-CoA carboxylase subunit epsilon [Nocardioides sp.]|uniref:acyl-CoA carboxylase subunit epsilon n=1 Tax=Nocardioides sp. TaxID=35761 RepID=UPI00356473D3